MEDNEARARRFDREVRGEHDFEAVSDSGAEGVRIAPWLAAAGTGEGGFREVEPTG